MAVYRKTKIKHGRASQVLNRKRGSLKFNLKNSSAFYFKKTPTWLREEGSVTFWGLRCGLQFPRTLPIAPHKTRTRTLTVILKIYVRLTDEYKIEKLALTWRRKMSRSCIELQKWHSAYNRTWLLIWDPLRTHLPARISQMAACDCRCWRIKDGAY